MASSPYPTQQGYGPAYTVTKRPMTDDEVKGLAKPFKSFKGPLAFFSLIGIIASVASFEAPEENAGIMVLMGLICGIIALALGITSLKIRKNVVKSMEDPSVTIVRGTAVRTVNPAGWAIGPVIVRDTAETTRMLRDGPASVEFIPPLRMVSSVNGVRLAKGAYVDGMVDVQPTAAYQAPAPVTAYQPTAPTPGDEPPPPPGFEPQQGFFCPSCGTKTPPGARFCPKCAREMPRL